jgi:D-3-phosphoglycerate dehydrogenase / 2-oxoglutarate reductase
MKILVADRFDSAAIEALRSLGEIEVRTEASADELPALVSELRPSVLLVRGTRVTARALAASDRLALVVRAGAGTENVDVDEASRRGVFVASTPGKYATAVAELVWGLILACDRRIPDQIADLRAGRWNRAEYARANGVWGKTLGVVGFGQVGREVAIRAKAFGMRVIAWSRRLTEAEADKAGVDYVANIVNVARLADVVSISVVSNPETEGLIGEKFFNAMRTGAIFVNTSRVGVIDERALAKAVTDKQLRCGIDVFSQEPSGPSGEFRNELVKLAAVYGTHHIGSHTDQAQRATASEAVRVIKVWAETGQVANCVNRAAATPATAILTVRHLNKPGVLAHIFYTLGQAQINVEEMDNVVYEGGEAACAKIQLSRLPSEEHIVTIRKNPNVLGTSLSLIKR